MFGFSRALFIFASESTNSYFLQFLIIIHYYLLLLYIHLMLVKQLKKFILQEFLIKILKHDNF